MYIYSDGLVVTHRLLLAAASPLARLVLGVDPEDHLVLPGVKVAEVQELLDGLCSGKLERSSDLLPLLTMLCIIGDEDDSEREVVDDEAAQYIDCCVHC